MSEGQAQRVALARAFLQDAPLIILDEPTAHLDPEMENWLQASISAAIKGRTALIIAHRLNTVKVADQILVMDQGRIVDAGTHPALMSREGIYRSLWREAGRGLPAIRWNGTEAMRCERTPHLPLPKPVDLHHTCRNPAQSWYACCVSWCH